MLVNILVVLFFIILINQIFLANNFIEGYMAVIGPVIYEKEKTKCLKQKHLPQQNWIKFLVISINKTSRSAIA